MIHPQRRSYELGAVFGQVANSNCSCSVCARMSEMSSMDLVGIAREARRLVCLAILFIPIFTTFVALVLIATFGHRNVISIAAIVSPFLALYLVLAVLLWSKLPKRVRVDSR